MTSARRWLLISDVDGTLTTETSIWETFHKQLGKWECEGHPNLLAYLAGAIDYAEFAARDAKAYKGLSRATLDRMAASIPRRKGMETMLRTMSRRGFTIALISTGLDILLDQIPCADIRIANRLRFDDNTCSGEADVVIPIDGKEAVARSVMETIGVSVERTVVIGDSRGDVSMMKAAGFSIAVAAESGVIDAASASVDGTDLMQIPALILDYREIVDSRRQSRHR